MKTMSWSKQNGKAHAVGFASQEVMFSSMPVPGSTSAESELHVEEMGHRPGRNASNLGADPGFFFIIIIVICLNFSLFL